VKLLFIKLKHIGDALLLTPTLTAVRAAHPSAEIWVVVRRGSEGILAGCPAIDRVLVSAAPEKNKRHPFGWLDDFKLLRELRRQKFDHAFELTDGDRGRLLAAWSGAQFRCANGGGQRVPVFWRPWFNLLSKHDWRNEHQVEANFHLVDEFLPLGVREPPPLVFDRAQAKPCDLGVQLANYVVVHPGTRWKRKRWPLEKWIETGKYLTRQGMQIVVSTGPDAEEIAFAEKLTAGIGHQTLTTAGRASWAQLAGLLYQAKLFVGVDTAAMHLAAACQCPTVAIFGDTVATHWHPWRVSHRLVLPSLPADVKPPIERAKLIQYVPVSGVIDAIDSLFSQKTAI
jgi:heptosyltransferase-3